jgi:catechol 2,3-dioxygenase-like lactoylglutathione lyase family enzyme
MEHVGIVVEDLGAATDFFLALGLELEGEMSLDDPLVGRIIGLEDAQTEVSFLRTPDGHGALELIRFVSPPSPAGDLEAAANTPGLRHLAFLVDDIGAAVADLEARGYGLVGELEQYGDSYKLCYVRGPEGIIVELAEKLG